MKKHVIVVGAGASGLMAARELSAEYKVTILESRLVSGGRIRSFYFPDLPQILEEGPEFVHGKLPITLSLFKEAGIKVLPLEGKLFRKKNGVLIEQDEMVKGWDELIKKMREEKENLTINRFLEKHFSGPEYAELRKQMIGYAEGFDVADPAIASIKELDKEWRHEGETFRIPDGYISLINFLESELVKKGVKVIKGQTVTKVNWKENEVEIITAGGDKFNAEKVIITLPVIHFNGNNDNSIQLIPKLPDYTNAFKQIGFGPVMKVMIHFKKQFWADEAGFILSDEQIPTWWSLKPINAPVLTGWAGGPMAESLSVYSDSELLEIALVSLSNIFNIPAEQLRGYILNYGIFNWKRFPEALGAYSFSTPASSEARKVLNSPVSNTIYFAGEGLYEGNYPGTVEAALTSGRDAAFRLRKG